MELKQLELTGGAKLTVYLRTPLGGNAVGPGAPAGAGGSPAADTTMSPPGRGPGGPAVLAAAGYHTAVLEYSVGMRRQIFSRCVGLSQAIGLVRTHAAAWGVEPEKIAVCGFSAGGHLALSQRCAHPAWGRGGSAAPAQCGRAGLSGNEPRCLCPPGQF